MRYTENQFIDKENTSRVINLLIKIFLYLQIFLVPLFFLPFTFEYYETSKLFLLIGFNLIILALILLKSIINGEFVFFRSKYELPFFLLLITSLFSTIFSINHVVSIFGYFGRGNETFIFFFNLILFVYIFVNVIENEISLRTTEYLVTSSACIVGILYVLTSFFKTNPFLHIFPGLGAIAGFSTLIDSSFIPFYFILAIFFVYSIILKKMSSHNFESFNLVDIFSISILSLILLAFYVLVGLSSINAIPLIILFASSIYLIFIILQMEFTQRSVLVGIPLVSMVFLIVSVLLYIAYTNNIYKPEVLSFGYSFDVYKGGILNIKNFLLGTGPDTFYFSFLKNIPQSFYATNQFSIGFTKAYNEFFQLLITNGILGTIFFYMLIIIGFIYSLRIFKDSEDQNAKIVMAYSGAILVSIFLMSLFIPFTLSISFILFLVLAIIALEGELNNALHKKYIKIKIVIENYWDNFSKLSKNIIYITFLLIIGILFYLNIYNYKTESEYLSSIKSTNTQQSYNYALSAYESEPFIDNYANQLALSSLTVSKAFLVKVSKATNVNTKDQYNAGVNDFLAQSIRVSELTYASNINDPNDVNAYINVLNTAYRQIDSNKNYITQAIVYAQSLNDQYPANLQYMDELGALYYENGNYDKSLSILKNLYNINDKSINYDYDYALALEANKKYAYAVPVLSLIANNLGNKSSAYAQVIQELENDEKQIK